MMGLFSSEELERLGLNVEDHSSRLTQEPLNEHLDKRSLALKVICQHMLAFESEERPNFMQLKEVFDRFADEESESKWSDKDLVEDIFEEEMEANTVDQNLTEFNLGAQTATVGITT